MLAGLALMLVLLCAGSRSAAAQSSNPTAAHMEEMLNQMDSANWGQPPAATQAPGSARSGFPFSRPVPLPGGTASGSSPAPEQAPLFNRQAFPGSLFNPGTAGRPWQNASPNLFNLTGQDILRIMLGGPSKASGNSAKNASAYSDAAAKRQVAVDQAAQADAAASRARYEQSRDARLSAAAEAQDHANAARYAADEATAAAAGGSSEAQDAAAQARNAADRAQAAADQAHANAEGGGW